MDHATINVNIFAIFASVCLSILTEHTISLCRYQKKIVSYVLSNSITNFTTIHVTVLWLWFP